MEYIQRLIQIPLSLGQLKRMLHQHLEHTEFYVYDDLQRFTHIDQILSKGACIILLQIETTPSPVGHFICLLKHKTHVEHFDSYGLSLDEETVVTGEKHLTKIFRTSPYPIKESKLRLQKDKKDVNTCGRWVVTRVLLRQLEYNSFIQLIDTFRIDKDTLVTLLTLFLPGYQHVFG